MNHTETGTRDRPGGAALAVVVLAAGQGTRMRSALPKVMHPLAGRPMILQVLQTANALSPDRTIVVVGPNMPSLADLVTPHPTPVQTEQLGTGHAVLQARDALGNHSGDVLILFGDTPLLTVDTLTAVLAARHGPADPAVVVLGFRPDDPGAYGRLVLAEDGSLVKIVEARDADPETLDIDLCNSGVMAVDGTVLFELLDQLGNANAKGEYYLTDLVALARAAGRNTAVVEAPADELLGVNSRADLAIAEAVMQDRLRAAALSGGATLVDPKTVWFSHDTRIGQDTIVSPNVVFGSGVTIGDGVDVLPFSHLEGVTVADGARIGPYARLRPGTNVGAGARIGNFVEIKAAEIEAGAKVNHLSYVGDAHVGAGANVGAGTITCNYDGFTKSLTEIGAGAFIGSNSALVAPVKVGDGAIVGAGSTITRDVEADAMAVTRADQKSVASGAKRFRERRRKSRPTG